MSKKVVLKIEIYDSKEKQKALKAVSSLSGIESLAMDMKDKKLTVIGDVDPVQIVSKLRKLWHTEILTVGPAKEPEKKKEEPKKDEKKDEKSGDDKAKDDKKKQEEAAEKIKKDTERLAELMKMYSRNNNPYYNYHPYSTTHQNHPYYTMQQYQQQQQHPYNYYTQQHYNNGYNVVEENPNSTCSIS